MDAIDGSDAGSADRGCSPGGGGGGGCGRGDGRGDGDDVGSGVGVGVGRGVGGVGDGVGGVGGVGGRCVLVSACLLGVACTDGGTANPAPAVVALGTRHRLVPVCPETAGGLPTPRPRAERSRVDGRVRTAAGADVTDAYERGAAHTVALARAAGADVAVLKARSPSCGCHEIYDGTFTRTRVPGEGVTAEALRRAGVEVVSEEDVAAGWHP